VVDVDVVQPGRLDDDERLPGFSSGMGTSSYFRTDASPCIWIRIAFTIELLE
jgi:hypothetical protein